MERLKIPVTPSVHPDEAQHMKYFDRSGFLLFFDDPRSTGAREHNFEDIFGLFRFANKYFKRHNQFVQLLAPATPRD